MIDHSNFVADRRSLVWLRSSLKEGYHSKNTKIYLLREIRRLEQKLGMTHDNYNGG